MSSQLLGCLMYRLVDSCSFKEFFKDMPQFCMKAAHILTGLYGSDWEKWLEVFMPFFFFASAFSVSELISE
jgi:hypothetical protein